MKMKKVLSLLLSFCMIFALAACGGNNDQTAAPANGTQAADATPAATQSGGASPEASGDEVSIVLATYPVGKYGDESTMTELIAAFNAVYPNIHVEVQYLDYTNGDDQVNTAINGGQAPDLIFEGPERLVANWGDKGYLVDLSDLWSSETSGQIYDFIETACKHPSGAYYEYPVCMTTHCMAINYDAFEAAGALQYIDEATHTWTTEGFINAVAALVANGQPNAGIVFCGGQGGDQGTRALINNLYGGTFTNAEHTQYTADSAENVKALQLLYDMEGIEFDAASVGSDEIGLFCNGTLNMAFCWNVAQELSETAGQTAQFEIFPMAFPTESGAPKLQGGIWGYGVFDNGDPAKIEAAKTLIRFMTEDDAQYTNAVLASNYWPVRELAGIYSDNEVMTEYGMFMQYMGDYYQVTSGWAEARTAWWNMLQQIGAGTAVEEAVAAFVETANTAAGN
ncbi:MAG: carbohydrate ABC transporter substrate-binding protein [Lachnospiraceae bacterium]|nr:carbohydrate ABC transporter substrate-binding protein [Lachnospiraceae bacterium]